MAAPAHKTPILIALIALASIIASVIVVLRLRAGGVARVEAETRIDGGAAIVRFVNRGTRAGFLCGWLNIACRGGAKSAPYLCSDDVAPSGSREKRAPLPGLDCTATFNPDDQPAP